MAIDWKVFMWSNDTRKGFEESKEYLETGSKFIEVGKR